MARPRKQKLEENKKEVKQEEVQSPKKQGVSLDIYFAVRKVKKHHQAGMRKFKDAENQKNSLLDWDNFFEGY